MAKRKVKEKVKIKKSRRDHEIRMAKAKQGTNGNERKQRKKANLSILDLWNELTYSSASIRSRSRISGFTFRFGLG